MWPKHRVEGMRSYIVFVVWKCLKYDAFEQKSIKNHTMLGVRILGYEREKFGKVKT